MRTFRVWNPSDVFVDVKGWNFTVLGDGVLVISDRQAHTAFKEWTKVEEVNKRNG